MSEETKPEPSPEIPADLQVKVLAIKNLVSIFDLLNRGSFDGFLSERLVAGMKFTHDLAEQMKKEARQHECADMVEGLKEEPAK